MSKNSSPIETGLPSNTVELRIVINRHNHAQRGIYFFRKGDGDDMVDSAADYFESVFVAAMHELLRQSGGQWQGQSPENPLTPPGE